MKSEIRFGARAGLVRRDGESKFLPIMDSINRLRHGCRCRLHESGLAGPMRRTPSICQPEPPFARTVSKRLHIAVTCRRITRQGRVDAGLHNPVQTLEISHRSGAKHHPPDHIPRRLRTSSIGTSSPGSASASSNFAAVSGSTISCSPSSVKNEIATATSFSGSASTRAWRRLRSDTRPSYTWAARLFVDSLA